MESMQHDERVTTRYYVQWYSAGRVMWVTPTDDLNGGGFDTEKKARTTGFADAVKHCGDNPARWPELRVVRRVIAESVI